MLSDDRKGQEAAEHKKSEVDSRGMTRVELNPKSAEVFQQ
jgi:hypothetical protein